MVGRNGTPKSRIETLGRIPLFAGLPKKVLARIGNHFDELHVQPGRELTRQGRGSYEVFVIEEGEAEVVVDDQVVGRAGPGELIGELGVLEQKLRTATVTAVTPMRLLVLDPRELKWLYEDKALAERVQANIDRHAAGPQPRG